jgi:GNAT superfamily N-acetyltransferase
MTESRIETHPLTPDRWRDVAALMNARFDTRRCWCMAPRLTTSYRNRSGATNRRALKNVVDMSAAPPGVLAYVDAEPAGWCAVAPRTEFPRATARARRLGSTEGDVWSVVCFLVLRRMRRRGVSRALLAAAVDLAAQHGAKTVEAYPVEGTRNLFRGVSSVFRDAGFEEVARAAPNRPIVRFRVKRARRRSVRTPSVGE